MSNPVLRKIKVLEAKYIADAESILILGECQEGQLKTQIHKNSFDFGKRTESEIIYEMEKTAGLMIGKTINLLFNDTIEDYEGITEPISREKKIDNNVQLYAKGLGL